MSPAVGDRVGDGRRRRRSRLLDTAQVATNFKQDLMATLPSNRTLDAVLLMAPAVHATGPRGAFTISGSQSYENLFTLNGAVITENLRGAPFTLYIEDALQEDDRVDAPAFRPSTADSRAASPTRSRSRAATASADRSGRRSPTTTGGRFTPFESDRSTRTRTRAQARQDRADLRSDLRRTGAEGSAVVLRRHAAQTQESTRTTVGHEPSRTSARTTSSATKAS